MKILNALSLNMYNGNDIFPVTKEVTGAEINDMVWVDDSDYGQHRADDSSFIGESCIGHADTARVVGKALCFPTLEANRVTVSFKAGDTALIAQYRGPRLQEGATELPEGAEIKFYKVEFRGRKALEELDELYDDLGQSCANMEWDDPKDLFKSLGKKYFPRYFREDAFE